MFHGQNERLHDNPPPPLNPDPEYWISKEEIEKLDNPLHSWIISPFSPTPPDKTMIDEINDEGIILNDGTELLFSTLSQILKELSETIDKDSSIRNFGDRQLATLDLKVASGTLQWLADTGAKKAKP